MTEALVNYVAAVNRAGSSAWWCLTAAPAKRLRRRDRRLADYDSPWQFGGRPDYCDAVRGLRKPVIAAINGYAFGGGLELALTCDIRLAADTASFAAPEIKLGWIGGGGMSALLAHSIGPSNAALMLLTGDPVDAPPARWPGQRITLPTASDAGASASHHREPRADCCAETAKLNLGVAFEMAPARSTERTCRRSGHGGCAQGRAAFAEPGATVQGRQA